MKIDKKYTLDFLKNILAIDSPTGFTEKAIAFLKKEAKALGYSSTVTPKGNLIVEVAGNDNTRAIGVCAHVDTLGLMVRSIKSDGKLAFTSLGGTILSSFDSEYCRIYTRDQKVYTGTILSTSPSVHVYKDARTLQREAETMEVRIDMPVKSKEDVLKLGINNGDYICIDPKTIITESGFIKSRFLDDKLSVAALFSILKYMHKEKIKPKFKTYFIFTVYEEVGHGNSWIPSDIDELLGVDMGCIGTDLACSEFDVSICAKDSSGPYDYNMVSSLINIAKKEKLNYAVDIYPMYGSDVSASLSGGNNIKGALVGPGIHASHGMERSHYDALKSTIVLLTTYLTK